jgi:hypothetical protein
MNDATQWEETESGYRLRAAEARKFDDPDAFVIMTFGSDATADTAFDCIVAAMRFGQMIAIRGDEENRILARELHHSGRVQFAPFVGLPFEAFAVAAVKAGNDPADAVGAPAGKTGNQLMEDDFADSSSRLALMGGPEFVDYCVAARTCALEGDVLEKFKEIVSKYPVEEEDEYMHFGVLIRERLIAQGLLPEGDPERYQYTVHHLASVLAVISPLRSQS